MEILIEEHTEECRTGVLVHYRVKFKRRWWSPWRYLEKHYDHGDPDIEKFYLKDDAVKAAWDLKDRLEKPKVTIRDLDVNGKSLFKYEGV
ncbi:hypothetical protein POP15_200 [Pectobacterium phage POP15]|nr:hypothetical protein POP15_200 [Pectobacterium phage POP15]